MSASSTPSPAAPQRDRAVRLTVAAAMGAKMISVVCTLAQVPLALHALGAEAYGLWITLMSLTIMLNFIDLGLGVGMQKTMAVAFGLDDHVRIRRIFFTGAAALGAFAVFALVLGLPVALLLDWGGMLKIKDTALQGQAGAGLAITLAAFALGLPFNALPRLAMATQRGWLQAGWIAVGSIASLAMVALAAKARWGFLPLLTLTTLMPTLQGLGFWLHLRHALGWKRSRLELLTRAEWRALAGESLLFSVPQLGLAVVQAAPPFVLSLAAGPVAATAFNLLQRLFSPVTQGQILFLNPLWPAVTEAHVRGESAWVRRAFRQSLLVAAGCMAALAGLTQFSGPLLHAWIGDAAVLAPAPLAWLTCAWFVTQVAWQPLMYLLVGVGQLSALAVWGLVGPALCLLGMAGAVVCHAGVTAVLAGAVLGLALGGLPGLAFATARALRGSPRPIAMKVVVFKVNHLGDNVVFLSAIQALHTRFPDWGLTVITTPHERVLYENLTVTGGILTCAKRDFDHSWQRPWRLAAWWSRVRSRRPDACLVSFDQANVPHWLARHSGAPVRVGGNLSHIRVRHSLTQEVPMPASGWVAEWNWDMARMLARTAGGVELPATPPPPDLSHLISGPPPHRARPRIVIHAGSSGGLTRWPVERFAAVAGGLARDHEVIWINRPETTIAVLPAGVTAVAPDSLPAFVTLLAGTDFFLGNNSGPMHLANALGLRGVVVTGSTARGWDPYWFRERWKVLRHPRLPCQPCERVTQVPNRCANLAEPLACLRYWTAPAVEAACRETLAAPPVVCQA